MIALGSAGTALTRWVIMAQRYRTVTDYMAIARLGLQDAVSPYRYPDTTLLSALNIGLSEMGRIRADMFLDLKYQQPLRKGDTDDGNPPLYTTDDVALNTDGSYSLGKGTPVPVPNKYVSALDWFINGWSQFLDVTDTQDARAQGFMAKFQSHLTTLSAA
jgi:hypothetical protein